MASESTSGKAASTPALHNPPMMTTRRAPNRLTIGPRALGRHQPVPGSPVDDAFATQSSALRRVRPDSGLALGPELVPGARLGVHAVLVLAALVLAGGAGVVLETVVRPPRPEEFSAGHHGGLPVEDDTGLLRADHHHVARLRTDSEELVLDADLRESVGKVAHRLVVREDGLPHPPRGLLATRLVVRAVGTVPWGDRCLLYTSPSPRD